MSITLLGIDAEKKARLFLKEKGYELQQIDWIGKRDNLYTIFEVKIKELFTPPPFLGTGLDKTQIYLRMQLFKDISIRTYLMVYEKGTENLYGQYLDVLEETKFHDTEKNIRIYNIKEFKKIKL